MIIQRRKVLLVFFIPSFILNNISISRFFRSWMRASRCVHKSCSSADNTVEAAQRELLKFFDSYCSDCFDNQAAPVEADGCIKMLCSKEQSR